MYPVNQVFLGNSDPLLSQSDITSQMQILKQYEAQLAQLQKKGTLQTDLIWDDIDKEMSSLTESQKARFFWRSRIFRNYSFITTNGASRITQFSKS